MVNISQAGTVGLDDVGGGLVGSEEVDEGGERRPEGGVTKGELDVPLLLLLPSELSLHQGDAGLQAVLQEEHSIRCVQHTVPASGNDGDELQLVLSLPQRRLLLLEQDAQVLTVLECEEEGEEGLRRKRWRVVSGPS